MEDISRELEKEIIASTRYSPAKRKIKSEFFLINNLGEIKSARWLKTFLWLISLISIIAVLSACLLYYLYSKTKASQMELNRNLAAAEKEINTLKKEKDILIAKLIISGKLPPSSAKNLSELYKKTENKTYPVAKNRRVKTDNRGKSDKHNPAYKSKNHIKPDKANEHTLGKNNPGIKTSDANTQAKSEKLSIDESQNHNTGASNKSVSTNRAKYNENKKYEKIKAEDFNIKRDKNTGELLVRFNIKNVSSNSENISGRIFVILKPDEKISSWLVVPSVGLKHGEPAIPNRGQYFSIAHFKSVSFRIKSNADPSSFKKASIFVYEKNKLIFMREIKIKT